MHMILFIDTEWADALANELVSLALVSDCGRFEFYAEREPLPSAGNDFVRDVVYPLLERGERALPDPQFTLNRSTYRFRSAGGAYKSLSNWIRISLLPAVVEKLNV